MIRICACGGLMQPLSDNEVYFRRRCERCGKIVLQRKRRKVASKDVASWQPTEAERADLRRRLEAIVGPLP